VSDPAAAEAERPSGEAGLARHGALSFVQTGLTLALNTVTGVLVARLLGADGRGELTAVVSGVPLIGWVFEMGCRQAVTYHHAKHPEDGARLLGTWLALLAPFSAAAIACGWFALPHLLAAQAGDTLTLARVFLVTIVLLFFGDLVYAVALADHDFLFYNVMRVLQPLGVACAYGALWAAGAFTVRTAVAVTVLAQVADLAVTGTRVLRRHGVARPSRALARTTLWYGVRAHGTTTAGIVTTRLDLAIIPAFLSASSVGLYAVATTVSWLVVTVSATLSLFVLPVAVRRGRDGIRTVVHSLWATFAAATALAAVLAACAGVAVRLVYGDEFSGSVTALRILLVGSVAYACAGVVCAGLYALNRPFTAALTLAGGALVTVPGLLLLLDRYGLTAAAAVSSVSYTLVLAGALLAYRRAAGIGWRDLAPRREAVRRWLHTARSLAG
jgi:O-antigen/teichoic acid export membrane protein